jgi:hypothetical protein
VPVRTRWIIAAILVLVGAVWVGQGLGIIRGSSFMTGDTRWALIGATLAIVGVGLALTALRARSAA